MSSSQHVKKLSATKQRTSLGGIKQAEKQKAKATNNRKVIRTTVVNSSEFDWPSISQDDENELINCLTSDLRGLRLPGYSVPLNEIRKVKKEERRDYRHKWLTQKYLEEGFNFSAHSKLREDILLGVNRISTSLEQCLVKCVIIEKDVDPPLLTKLLIPLANSRGIPIIAISGLNTTCKASFNTNCIAIGLKENCNDPNHSFNRIFRLVHSIWEKQRGPVSDDTVSSSTTIPVPHSSSLSKANIRKSKSKHFKPLKIRRV